MGKLRVMYKQLYLKIYFCMYFKYTFLIFISITLHTIILPSCNVFILYSLAKKIQYQSRTPSAYIPIFPFDAYFKQVISLN